MDYQYINLSYFDENFGGDQAFIEEILDIFLQEVPQKTSHLAAAVDSEDWEQAGEIAHSIKASVKMLGLHDLYTHIVTLEKRAKENPDRASMAQELHQATQILDTARVEIQDYLSNQ